MDVVEIFCDGGCRGNGQADNIGGWGVYFRYRGNEIRFKGSQKNTTNNAMELMACIQALRKLTPTDLVMILTSDSQYVINGINSWSRSWIKKGWRNSKGRPVENKVLWQELLDLSSKFPNLVYSHCRGHGDNMGNLIADALVNEAMDEAEVRNDMRMSDIVM